MQVAADSWVDFRLTNSAMIGAGGVNASGMVMSTDGNDNTLTRMVLRNNIIAGFQGNGINMLTAGETRTLLELDGNTIGATVFNGNPIGGNGPGTDPANLPYFDGVNLVVSGDSVLNARITNNTLNDNFERSIDILTTDSGISNLLLVGNTMGSDFGEDAAPAQTSNLVDMVVANDPGGTTCLAMSNNKFQWPAFVTNAAGAAGYILELDGLTNGLGVPIVIGPVTTAPFGTFCEPAIAAEEAFFIASGFDP
jgi:hypothetical protein